MIRRGSQVTIQGSGFTGVNAVRFANNVSATFTVNSDTQIVATVPQGAVTGPITISKANCTDAQTLTFSVGSGGDCGNPIAITTGAGNQVVVFPDAKASPSPTQRPANT